MRTQDTTTYISWCKLAEMTDILEKEKKAALSKEQTWLVDKIEGEIAALESVKDFLASIPQAFATLIDKCPTEKDIWRILVLFAREGEYVNHDFDKTEVSNGSINGCGITFATLETD